jgi:hypothetical protein
MKHSLVCRSVLLLQTNRHPQSECTDRIGGRRNSEPIMRTIPRQEIMIHEIRKFDQVIWMQLVLNSAISGSSSPVSNPSPSSSKFPCKPSSISSSIPSFSSSNSSSSSLKIPRHTRCRIVVNIPFRQILRQMKVSTLALVYQVLSP